MHTRPFDPSDVEALFAMQSQARVTRDWIAGELTDPARAGGQNVVIVADSRVRAGAGFVPADPNIYVAPAYVGDIEAGLALFRELVARVTTGFLRVSAFPDEHHKVEALTQLGFERQFAFITLARSTSSFATSASTQFARVPVDAIPLEQMREIHNRAFAGVPNSPDLSLDEVRHVVTRLNADASGVWRDAHGTIAGYAWILPEAEHASVDAIAVLPEFRRMGLAAIMSEHALDAAARFGITAMHALIASTNLASLALHHAAGYTEHERRDVWQLTPSRPR